MRRKSERTSTKKSKASPEKKVEKVKRTRSKRKKSTSSENESADEASPASEPVVVPETEQQPPKTPVKEGSQEETGDQVWQVKAPEAAGDDGEIQKLKICLTRPPSTPERPERPDRSPRSKRKHSRATSSSDAPSEVSEEKKKTRHHSKRGHRESKDGLEKNESQGEEIESEAKCNPKDSSNEVTQSDGNEKVGDSESTITSQEDGKGEEKANVDSSEDSNKDTSTEKGNKASDADTTVVSPEDETTVVSATPEPEPSNTIPENQERENDGKTPEPDSPTRRRSASVDKSEILELHPEETKIESDLEADKSKLDNNKEESNTPPKEQVSKSQDKTPIEEKKSDSDKTTNKPGVVESSKSDKRSQNQSADSQKDQDTEKVNETSAAEGHKSLERSDSIQSNQDDFIHNGQAAPIVVSRKRRWGSRPAKVTTQKSITISSDVLKDIIPDVKPVEFEEVIEERKPKREVTEKIERPVLPKIVIDNSENVERVERDRKSDRKEYDDKERDTKPRESHLAANRKISIIKDNESIIARPPSPPRYKQSSVLHITNLVRPFTLPQLKNLLQRTGRIVENGFWIDKIKSKCFVIYEKEDQAVETRHALHGVTWPVSNPKALQVDFSTQEAFDKAKLNEDFDNAQVSTIPGTVEDWLREQDMKRERGEVEKPWERKLATREWDLGKNDKDKEKERLRRDERPPLDKRRQRSPERSPEPARKFKKKEEEAPAKLLDDLFKKTKTTPCIYWLPLSAETIAVKEEQRRQHMAEYERRKQEQQRRPQHRRH